MDAGIVWEDYVRFFDWNAPAQAPMDAATRLVVARMVADILRLSPEVREIVWGIASPPGRFAQTVIHLWPDVEIGDATLRARAMRLDVTDIGVKVFKANQDAGNAAGKIVPFQEERARRGGPLQSSRHVQKILSAGWYTDAGEARPRGYVVQEWVAGQTLEELAHTVWPQAPLTGIVARSLLQSLYGEIVIEVWSALEPGSGVVWDWRDAQLVVSAPGDLDGSHEVVEVAPRLILVDTDSLLEMATPRPPEQRARQEANAFRRLRAMTARLLKAQGLSESESRIKAAVDRAWDTSELGRLDRSAAGEGALCRLGQTSAPTPEARAVAQRHCDHFLDRLQDAGFLR